MIETDKLSAMFTDVSLNKTITECVVNVKDEIATVYALDLTESVFVQTSTDLQGVEDCQFGIGSLDVFVRYLNMIRGSSIKVSIDDSRLIIVPKKGRKLSYLLAEPDLIVTYEDSFLEQGDVIQGEFSDYDYGKGIDLKQEEVKDLLGIISLFDPNSISLRVNSKGKLTIHTGNETQHQSDISFGKTSCKECEHKLYSEYFASILSIIKFEHNPKMFISNEEGSSVIITTDNTGWILQPETVDV
ncbi:MAG: hypothetical protein DRO67_00350 [Candidatus Asgardarchaeum californiense]|nr:MAG: hypothetical protein DRO67_00350 [Candidatus Asgardarchaeum californiense]